MLNRTLSAMRARRERGEGGFTLAEMLVVVVIIATVSAIAVPIYLGQRGKAVDSKMEADLSAIASLMAAAYSTNTSVTFTEGGSTISTASESDAGLRSVTVDGVISVTGFTSGQVPSAGDCVIITREDGSEGQTCLPGESDGDNDNGTPTPGSSSPAPEESSSSPLPLTITYANFNFTPGSDNEIYAPSVSGGSGSYSFSYSPEGSLPLGMTFNATTGEFTGPAENAWNFLATQVDGGEVHTCALATNGTVKCWGRNNYGQVDGVADDTKRYRTPWTVPNISNATQISAGQFHTCARLNDGTVKCWGRNNASQLGGSSTSAVVPDLSNVLEVSAGYNFTCARLSGGSVKCWGGNASGQLGDGTTIASATPKSVMNVTSATDIDAGESHACAVLTNKEVLCWGSNAYQQLSNSNIATSKTVGAFPSATGLLTDVVKVSLGKEHSCALRDNGTVRCWGNDNVGQIGNGSAGGEIGNDWRDYNGDGSLTSDELSVEGWHLPVSTSSGPLTEVIDIAAGDEHTCATLSDNSVRCWGQGARGRLGTGNTTILYAAPSSSIANLENVTGLTAGFAHTCALTSGGSIRCWGAASHARLGDGRTWTTSNSANQHTPVAVSYNGPQEGFPITVDVTVTDSVAAQSTFSVVLSIP
jgi:prepilin-type N-terminal cleavage/methylation domain-containing protein